MIFYDGEKGDKYIILINDPEPKGIGCFVKVTSQPRGPFTPGCLGPSHQLFFIPAKAEHFPLPTWVQLHEVYPYAHDSIQPSNGVVHCGRLSSQSVDGVIKCLLAHAGDDLPQNLLRYIQPSKATKLADLAARFKGLR